MWNLRRLAIVVFLGITVALVGVILLLTLSIPHEQDVRQQLQQIAKPHAFDFVSWELYALSCLPKEMLCKGGESGREAKLCSQIRTVLVDKSIPTFPPITFRLEKPPHLLVASPRDRILYFDRRVLRQELSVEEMETLEASS